jgi:hypothetical protein
MKFVILVVLVFNSIFSFSQDILIKVNGESLIVKIKKISENEITFKKWSFLDGPDYSLSTSSVYEVIFENGITEIFNKAAVEQNEIAKDPKQAIKMGNNVFITSVDATSMKGEEYFIQNLKGWGYWNVVENKESAHFILVLTIDRKGMGVFKIWATFKTLNGKEFKTSKTFKKSVSAFNGYNVARPLSEKLVNKYFKKEFNQSKETSQGVWEVEEGE